MYEKEMTPSAGQAESADFRENALGVEGRVITSTKSLYNTDDALSSENEKKEKRVFTLGMGLKEKTCIVCGKIYIPTRPKYAWGCCCSYHCFIHCEKTTNRGRIRMYGKDRAYLKTFETIEEARDFCGLKHERSIYDFFSGRTKSAGGFLWAWEETD